MYLDGSIIARGYQAIEGATLMPSIKHDSEQGLLCVQKTSQNFQTQYSVCARPGSLDAYKTICLKINTEFSDSLRPR